jgi:(2Fe-2S) ferredoxin
LKLSAASRDLSKLKKVKTQLLVCQHKTCKRRGGKSAAKELKRALKEHDLRERVLITKVKCLDQCGRGPVAVVHPEGVWYGGVGEQGAREIVERHLAGGQRAGGCTVLHEMRAAPEEA